MVEHLIMPFESEPFDERLKDTAWIFDHLFVNDRMNVERQQRPGIFPIAEGQVIKLGRRIEPEEAGHRAVQPEITDEAAEEDISRMAERKYEFRAGKQTVDGRSSVEEHRRLVDQHRLSRQRHIFSRDLEIAIT